MRDRIGELQLHYRVPRGGSAAAVPPSLDRAVQARLAEALEARLAAAFGDDGAVVVVREAAARVVLERADWSLDGRAVDRICRSSLDAVAAVLARPRPDLVARWSSEVEFAGAFVLELLAGTAWERWWFGAFRRCRRATVRETLEAVLADEGERAPAVLAWLAARGRLEEVLGLLGPEAARAAAAGGARERDAEAPDLAPLAAAAFRLLSLLGLAPSGADAQQKCLARFLATGPLPPAWSDARALSAWVLALVRFAVAEAATSARGAAHTEAARAAVVRELQGPLDWLDAPWLAPRLAEVAALAAGGGPSQDGLQVRDEHVLAERDERLLEQLAEAVREGRIPVDRARPEEALVRLLAAAAEARGGAPDRGVTAAIERVSAAWRAVLEADLDRGRAAELVEMAVVRHAAEARAGAEARRVWAAGASAPGLLRALVAAVPLRAAAGDVTRGASLFLLTRTLLDLRVDGLAHHLAVPLAPLLAALAGKWLGLAPPFDGPTALWVGAEAPDLGALPPAGLEALAAQLEQVLRDRRVIDDDTAPLLEADAAASPPIAPPAVDGPAARVAAAVLREWAHWLPRLRTSSASFLRQGCLERGGTVSVIREAVEVLLEPAPLDVVLEMAGYLQRIDRVPWLDGRAVRFAVRRAVRTP